MKVCSKCKLNKEDSEFNRNHSKSDGLQQYCKSCHRILDRQSYFRHTETYYQRNRRRKLKVREFIRSLKTECSRCGFNNPDALDFHHIDPSSKVVALGASEVVSWGTKRVLAEISKCELLCANCHRIEEYERRRTATELAA